MKGPLLSIAGLMCPLIVVGVVMLLRSGALTFREDYLGFGGLGFLLKCLLVLVPSGLVTSGLALWKDRRSRLAWIAVAVNLVMAGVFLLMVVELAF